MHIAKANRMQSQDPKSGLFWCNYCDRHPVGIGGKCPHCKHRQKTKRLKRHVPAIEFETEAD